MERTRTRRLRRWGLIIDAEVGSSCRIVAARIEWLGRRRWRDAVAASTCQVPRDPLDWCRRASIRDVDFWDDPKGTVRSVAAIVALALGAEPAALPAVGKAARAG